MHVLRRLVDAVKSLSRPRTKQNTLEQRTLVSTASVGGGTAGRADRGARSLAAAQLNALRVDRCGADPGA